MGRRCARSNCPFCGFRCTDMVVAELYKAGTYRERPRYAVQCCSAYCRARGPIAETKREAAKLWDAQQPIRLDRKGDAPAVDFASTLR